MNNIVRATVAALILAGAISLLTHSQTGAVTSTSTAPIRGYYLTKNTFTGSKVLSACASGYHFASIWEIENTSDLHYNSTLGLTNANSGLGAPSISYSFDRSVIDAPIGWIRTGGVLDANCKKWTSRAPLIKDRLQVSSLRIHRCRFGKSFRPALKQSYPATAMSIRE